MTMWPAWRTLILCIIAVCATEAVCQYEDSFDDDRASRQDQESGSHEMDANDEMEGYDSDKRIGNGGYGGKEDDTTVAYGNDEAQGEEDSPETTTIGRLPERDLPSNGPFSTPTSAKSRPQSGDAYVQYRSDYPNYFGRYFGELSHHLENKPAHGPPEVPKYNVPPYPLPDSRVNPNFDNDLFETGSNSQTLDMSSENQMPPDYLHKPRMMVVMARLRKRYGAETHPLFVGLQPASFAFTRIISVAARSSIEVPESKLIQFTHNLTQIIAREMESLKGRLRTMELERIKLFTVLIQFKSILNEMYERSTADGSVYANRLNMSQHEMYIARLCNLFMIPCAVTRLSPLTPDEIKQINYDVGLFDTKINDKSKLVLTNRIRMILVRKAYDDKKDRLIPSSPNETSDYISKASKRNSKCSDVATSLGSALHCSRNSVTPSSKLSTTAREDQDRHEILRCKLRRLRNLYLLVRPLVTGTKLTRTELREIFRSHEGFFEPGLTEAQKIALVYKMAETIRTAFVPRQLVLNPNLSTSSAMSSSASTITPIVTSPGSELSPASPFVRSPLSIIAQRPNSDSKRAPPSDKMHVSGRIRMDLNVERDMNPTQEGILPHFLKR
ncbi:uncharacterized protein LOC111254111 isoform X1 [Varroa destructor]|uniref:Uncharacterized protein n=1 Tax=Varroa destructor TaxID=109461 RepID=A0A7M7L4W1_VARDE|nr:uncharacterized protein LOC111254111 isoform X1 [Varroa destructor]